MPIRKSTRASKLTVQPVSPSPVTPAAGSLPTQNEKRPAVPEIVQQGDSFFSRDSIGSAKFDSRMDFPALAENSTQLEKLGTTQGMRLSLSSERPTLLASVDIFNSPASSLEKTAMALDQSIKVAEFESNLMKVDYDYIYETLKADEATSATMQSLEDQATTDLQKTKDAVDSFLGLSNAAEELSKTLDIRLSWSNVEEKISEYYSQLPQKYGSTTIDTSLSSFGLSAKQDTSTGIVKTLSKVAAAASAENTSATSQGNLVVGLSKGYFSIDSKVTQKDLLFDDGKITNYSELSSLFKVSSCAEFLSRVFTDTFTGVTSSAVVSVLTAYSGSSIFESQGLKDGRKIISSHYEGIIDPSVRSLSTSNISDFTSTVVPSFSDSYDAAKTKTGIGLADEAGTPIDIYLRMLGKVKDSFETLYASKETSIFTNNSEINDAVMLAFATKSSRSSEKFNGFMRGVLLTMLLDEEYFFDAAVSDEYDEVNESKSEIEDSGDTSGTSPRTVGAKIGTKKLKTKTLEEIATANVDAIFSVPERLKNFPATSHQFTKSKILQIDTNEVLNAFSTSWGTSYWLGPSFAPSWPSTDPAFIDSSIEQWDYCAPLAVSVPEAIKQSLVFGTPGNDITTGEALAKTVYDNFKIFSRSENGKTAGNAILDLYDELVALFEELHGKKLDDVAPDGKFITGTGTCTKRGIIDVIFECMANLIIYFLGPGYTSTTEDRPTEVPDFSRSKEEEEGNYTGTSRTDEGTVTVEEPATIWYLSVNSDFYEILSFCETASQLSGDENEYLANAYTSSGLSATSSSNLYNNLVSVITDLVKRHKSTKIAVSSLAALADVISTSCENFSSAISSVAEKTAIVSEQIRNDVAANFTIEVASSLSLKEKMYQGVRESFEESLNVYDVSAARWFYNYYKKELSSDKTCLVVGLPAGLSSMLGRSEITVKDDKIASGELSLNKYLSKYSMTLSARSIQKPYSSVTPLTIGKFHPLVNCYITSEISKNSTILGVASSGEVTFECYDRGTGTWVSCSYDECRAFIGSGGNFSSAGDDQSLPSIPSSTVNDTIKFHVIDAILKATIRVVSGIDFSSYSICSPRRLLSATSAGQLLSLLDSARTDLIPRGGLRASDFLEQTTSGDYASIPFSGLRGNAANLTKPSDHSLLLKLLDSGIFTAGTSASRILTPDPFERVYCVIYDPNDLVIKQDGQTVRDGAVREISLCSINIEAE